MNHDEIRAKVDRVFNLHPVYADMNQRLDNLRDEAKNLAALIYLSTPQGPEQTLAVRKLDESLRWAIAAIVRPPVEP